MTHDRRAILGLGMAGAGLLVLGRTAAAAAPGLVGPLADTAAKGLQTFDPSALGYVAEEYFMSGTANVYEPVSMADTTDTATRDNTADQARRTFGRKLTAADRPYTTRVVVYRPADLARFSGNVIAESFHPAGGGRSLVWTAIHPFFIRNGDAYVGVQHPTTFPGLKAADPARYGALSAEHPSQLWGMIADAGRRVKTGRSLGVQARRLYLTGYSFTGVVTATFANYHHNEVRLAGGKPVFDGYASMASAMYVRPLDVPVMRMLNESDFNHYGAIANRGDSGPRYRLYELAGASHAVAPHPEAGSARPPRPTPVAEGAGLPSFSPQACYDSFPKGSSPDDYPTRLFQAALFANLYAWVDKGVAPPPSAFIETDASGEPRRDRFGNALGGMRLPPVEVPIASYGMGREERCFLFGYAQPFSAERKRELYGSHAGYVAKVEASARQAVGKRLLLPQGAAELAAWAKSSETF